MKRLTMVITTAQRDPKLGSITRRPSMREMNLRQIRLLKRKRLHHRFLPLTLSMLLTRTGTSQKLKKSPFQKRKFMPSKRRATTLQPTTDGRSPIFTVVMALVMGVVTMIKVTKGGKASRVVNYVLAIKSYDEWKQSNRNGVCKFGGSIKPPSLGKSSFMRKYSDPFMNSLLRTSSNNNEKSPFNTASNKLDSLFNCLWLVLSSEAKCLMF